MIKEAIEKVSRGLDLSAQEMESVFSLIARGEAAEDDVASFISALAVKKETAEEIAAAARVMRRYVVRIPVDARVIFDTCGTGGDNKGTFNISTICALVVAGCGITVAKHGNRSVSGVCGSADLLEALGVNINAGADIVKKCIERIGIGFLFAPLLHPAMRYVQSARRKLKTRTIFNILGPLINPAYPTHQLLGVYDRRLVAVLGTALKSLGIQAAMVVWGSGGYDEVTTTAETQVCETSPEHLKEYSLAPEKFGLARALPEDLLGADIEGNKHIALNVLKGMEGPRRDVVVLNAGCGLYVCGAAHTIKEGMNQAAASIDSGAAIKKLNKLIEYTNS